MLRIAEPRPGNDAAIHWIDWWIDWIDEVFFALIEPFIARYRHMNTVFRATRGPGLSKEL
jgi:hypothetical protein